MPPGKPSNGEAVSQSGKLFIFGNSEKDRMVGPTKWSFISKIMDGILY